MNEPTPDFASMPPKGERLTLESFLRRRSLAISCPNMMIASDGILELPRATGTYARVPGQ